MKDKTTIDLVDGKVCQIPFEVPNTFAYDPNADCPRWKQFIDEIACGDERLVVYLQRLVGYCLTDDTRERQMFLFYGTGTNGKSAFVKTVAALLGEYAVECQPEIVLGGNRRSSSGPAMARLENARLAIASDINDGFRLDEEIIKGLTEGNGTKLIARRLYEKAFEFTVKFKVMLVTSHMPIVKKSAKEVWKRIRIVPFKAQIPIQQRDKTLPEKLQSELPGIFNWALQGAVDWYAYGLPELEEQNGLG